MLLFVLFALPLFTSTRAIIAPVPTSVLTTGSLHTRTHVGASLRAGASPRADRATTLLTKAAQAITTLFTPATATAASADQLNFQARLQTAGGAIVPDGYYNIEFKLYSASTGGTALWTEPYAYNSGSGSCAGPVGTNDCRVRVVNGYVSVYLGSHTSFPSTIPWDQQLYLTMNVGGTTDTGSITYDGEMTPRLKLTAVPYAMRANSAKQLQGTDTTSGNQATLQLPTAITGGNQTFQIQDQGAGGTYTLLTQEGAGTALAGSFIQNQNSGAQTSASFWVDGIGKAAAGIQGPSFDTIATGVLALGQTNATNIQIGSTATDAIAHLFILDSYNGGSDPTGYSGAMYYNTSMNKFRCYENGVWSDCNGSGGSGGANTSLSNLTATNINQPLNTTTGDLTLQTTTSGNINLSPVGTINLNQSTVIASGRDFTVTNGTTSVTGTATIVGAATINGSGSAATSIGTGTGNVTVGNTTGTLGLTGGTIDINGTAAVNIAMGTAGVNIGTTTQYGSVTIKAESKATYGTIAVQGSTSSGAANMAGISFVDASGARTGFIGDASALNSDIFLMSDSGNINLSANGTINLNQDTTVAAGKNLTLTSGALTINDVTLSRGAADRLDLATGDSFNVVSGNIQTAGTIRLDASGNLVNIGLITGQGTANTTDSIVLNRTFKQGTGTTYYYKLATLPTSSAGTYDQLHLNVTVAGWGSSDKTYLDATFANRNSFTYQYTMRGAAANANRKLAAYSNADGSVDIYIVLNGADYTVASYSVIENLGATVYANPYGSRTTTAPSGGSYVFDSSDNATYPPATQISNAGAMTVASTIQGTRLISTVATGTSPLQVTSTTLVSNLNADLLDGQQGSYYQNASNINAGSLSDSYLSSNVVLLNNAQTITGAKIFTSQVTLNNGNNIVLQANSSVPTDAGDIVFKAYDGTEYGRIYSNSNYIAISGSSNTSTDLKVEEGAVTAYGTLVATSTLQGASLTVGSTANQQVTIGAGAGSHAIEIGRRDGTASTPFIDFHSGATATDYDARIIAGSGTGVSGGGSLQLIASTVSLGSASIAGRLALYDGSSHAITLNTANQSGNYTVTIPTITANDTVCLQNLANCGASNGQIGDYPYIWKGYLASDTGNLTDSNYTSYSTKTRQFCTTGSGSTCELNIDGAWSGDAWTPPYTGYYQITLSATFSNVSSGNRLVGIVKNVGTSYNNSSSPGGWIEMSKFAPTTDVASTVIHTIVYLTTSDKIMLIGRVTSPSIQIRGGTYNTNMTIMLLRVDQ
jgi:hypothetical protein